MWEALREALDEEMERGERQGQPGRRWEQERRWQRSAQRGLRPATPACQSALVRRQFGRAGWSGHLQLALGSEGRLHCLPGELAL